MDRIVAFAGLIGLAVAAGALVVGDVVVASELKPPHPLLDANQVVSVAGPLRLRCAEFMLAGVVLLAVALPRWAQARWATACALLTVAAAAAHRFALLPQVNEAWGRVDLVAQRPVQRMAEATELASHAEWMAVAIGLGLAVIAGLIASSRAARVATVPVAVAPASEKSPEPALAEAA